MYSTLFKVLGLLVFFHSMVPLMGFSLKDCLDANFSESIEHPSGIGGFMRNKISINKEGCNLSINYKKFKFFDKHWNIDVCRLPVHIKEGEGLAEIYKRNLACYEKERKDDFCKHYREIMDILQDDGLIFAEGEKDLLTTPHGHVFCSYVLLRSYLLEGKVFARHEAQIWSNQSELNPVYPQEHELQLQEQRPVSPQSTPLPSSVTPEVIPSANPQ